jgi:hypothetical protein
VHTISPCGGEVLTTVAKAKGNATKKGAKERKDAYKRV